MPDSITLERKALASALGLLARIVEKRTTIPVLGNVRLRRADTLRLEITATDLDIEAVASVDCNARDCVAGAETTLPAHALHDITRKLPDGAQVKITWADDRATIISGRSRFTLNCIPAVDFPDISIGEFSNRFTIPAETLGSLLGKTTFAISNEETRYYLNGVFFHAVDDMLVAVATDGHRLAKATANLPDGAGGMPGVIVPRKAVAELQRLCEAGGNAFVEVSSTKIRVAIGAVVLTSKLIDGSFPDYGRVIPTANNKIARVAKATLAAAVERVMTVQTERGRAVRLHFDEGTVKLSANDPNGGEAADEAEAEYDAADLSIGFNGRYLLDALAHVEGETVEIALSDPGSPTIFRAPDDARHLIVLMPMRV